MKSISSRPVVVGFLILVLTILLPSACDDFALVDLFYRDSGLPLAIDPGAAAVQPSNTLQFVGSGGAPEYTFRVVDPGGGTIDPATGVYTAPVDSGQYTVELTDRASRTTTAEVYVVAPTTLRIEPTTAAVEVSDTQDFTASGGTPPYFFSVEGDIGTIAWSDAVATFTAGAAVGHETVRVSDDHGAMATATVYVYDDTGELMLIPERNPIHQGQRTGLTVHGGNGSGEYELSVDTEDLVYDDGPGELVQPPDAEYVASDSIGTVTIKLIDPEGFPDTALLDITILPAPPTNLAATWEQGKPTVTLTWEYDKPGIEGFRIERAREGEPYVIVATVPEHVRQYPDSNGLAPGKAHEYQVFAIREQYESEPASIYTPPR